MEEVQFKIDDKNNGLFYIEEGEEQIGKMEVTISKTALRVSHTEVVTRAEGKGLAKKLLEAMVVYARKNALQVQPFCPFVLAQFKRHPEQYADIWVKNV